MRNRHEEDDRTFNEKVASRSMLAFIIFSMILFVAYFYAISTDWGSNFLHEWGFEIDAYLHFRAFFFSVAISGILCSIVVRFINIGHDIVQLVRFIKSKFSHE